VKALQEQTQVKQAGAAVVIKSKINSMKKIFFSVLALYIGILSCFSQSEKKDSSQYRNRKLKVEEINLVSSYYQQDGDHAAVTGGIGSQKLTDIANVFDVRLNSWDSRNRKHVWDLAVGIDHYTSASSDMIDPHTISSASYSDTRVYPSLGWSMENETKGTTIGAGVSSSFEFDYQSVGVNVNFAKKTSNRNGEFSAKLQAYLDKVSMILPVELRTGFNEDGDEYPTESRNSFSSSLTYSQIINRNLQIMFLLDFVYQQGHLGLPFHRVYFDDFSVHSEKLPSNRFKIPIGFRANYFLGDRLIFRAYYRYYRDDWGLSAHTAEIETAVKITPFFSISPFYRFYKQTAVNYFAPYGAHTAANEFYTSNYDLSQFHSNFFGAGIRYSSAKGVLGITHFSMIELRYGHYIRSNSLNSDILSLNLQFK
jgi:hypothetical protein